jgi:hypothetical protein
MKLLRRVEEMIEIKLKDDGIRALREALREVEASNSRFSSLKIKSFQIWIR